MLDLFLLEQFVTFAEYGTLSKAADQLHISQPTLTRSMQKIEQEFGVPLFRRTKNKMEFNENGMLAVDHARKILEQTKDMVELVRAFDLAKNTISIGSCAPMPMASIVQNTNRSYPKMRISAEIKDNNTLLSGLYNENYDLIILPYKPDGYDLCVKKYKSESLFFALPSHHPLASSEGLYMKDLDGENMLLLSDIGFWHELPTQKMPHSRFLIQSERFDFDELIQSSILPSFVSDMTIQAEGIPSNRKIVPILDSEATVTYYLICLKSSKQKLNNLF